jgi:tetratricopeptide (TPR) repeat protein
VYLQTGQYQKAADDFTRIIKRYNADSMTFYGRGTARMHLGDFAGAIADLDDAIDRNRAHAPSYNVRGLAHYIRGSYDLAIYDFTQCINRGYDNAEVYYNRGRALYMQGLYGLARDNFAAALAREPSHHLAYLFSWHLRMLAGEVDDDDVVRVKLSLGLDAHPHHNTLLLKVSEAYLERNNRAEACRWAEEARKVIARDSSGDSKQWHGVQVSYAVRTACRL